MSAQYLTDSELYALVVIERVGSALSLVGCIFIIATFLSSSAFHKPINRLVFYASAGNIMTNIATIMSRSTIGDPASTLCHFQAFLIQMFMCADTYWTLAMACNVYLTFFHKYDGEKLRTMEKYYFLVCYGLPFIPALVYLFIQSPSGNSVYGDATLWCWISKDFDFLRIATFYGPVWIAITITSAIYLRAGTEIYIKRKQLLNFNDGGPDHPMLSFSDPFTSTKTTEILVTSEAIEDVDQKIQVDLNRLEEGEGIPDPSGNPLYSVTISTKCETGHRFISPPFITRSPPLSPSHGVHESTPNSVLDQSRFRQVVRNHISMEANRAAWSYTKVAVLFFTALLVTWLPSSANRVYSIIYPGYINPALQLTSAVVLPLQGFWNALIYAMTSWKACRGFFSLSLFRTRAERAIPLGFGSHDKAGRLGSGDDKSSETGSTIELSSRPMKGRGQAD